MLSALILLMVLPLPIFSVSTINIDSLIITQVQDATAPNENSNAYVVTSTITLEGFFVDTGMTNSTTRQLISVYQQGIKSTTKPPRFVFITHGHPDHMAGIALIRRTYPSTLFYVVNQQVATEGVKWIGRFCSFNALTSAQCALNYQSILRPLTAPQTQLSLAPASVTLAALSAIVKAETSYAGFLGLTTSSGAYYLFTGDVITIQTHLYTANLFENDNQPGSDDTLCAWAGIMQASACDLQLGKSHPTILPGHGPISDSSRYIRDITRNIEWLRALRRLTFNSCNATYIWIRMLRMFPDFGGILLNEKGSLATHVPADAQSVHCECTDGSPSICPVRNAPPSCVHLDYTQSDSTLACQMRFSVSPTLMQPIHMQLAGFIVLNALIILILSE